MNLTKRVSDEPRTIFEHIEELRRIVFVILGSIIIGAIITHHYHDAIIAFILKPIGEQNLVFLSPLEPLFFIFKVDLFMGIFFSFPIINWCFFSYIRQALPETKKAIFYFTYLVSLFFILLSLVYSYFVTIPISLKFLNSIVIEGVKSTVTVSSYISFLLTQVLIMIIVFQIPTVMMTGTYLKIIKAKVIAEKRRYFYLFGTIALAIITPTTDIFNLSIVLVPAILVFELSLVFSKIISLLSKKESTL